MNILPGETVEQFCKRQYDAQVQATKETLGLDMPTWDVLSQSERDQYVATFIETITKVKKELSGE